ncbi:MAG: hypothetical protein Q9217_002845 [Psora testacea]
MPISSASRHQACLIPPAYQQFLTTQEQKSKRISFLSQPPCMAPLPPHATGFIHRKNIPLPQHASQTNEHSGTPYQCAYTFTPPSQISASSVAGLQMRRKIPGSYHGRRSADPSPLSTCKTSTPLPPNIAELSAEPSLSRSMVDQSMLQRHIEEVPERVELPGSVPEPIPQTRTYPQRPKVDIQNRSYSGGNKIVYEQAPEVVAASRSMTASTLSNTKLSTCSSDSSIHETPSAWPNVSENQPPPPYTTESSQGRQSMFKNAIDSTSSHEPYIPSSQPPMQQLHINDDKELPTADFLAQTTELRRPSGSKDDLPNSARQPYDAPQALSGQCVIENLPRTDRGYSSLTKSVNAVSFRVSQLDSDSCPLLVAAAHDGLRDMMQELIYKGADIEAVNLVTGRTALSEAALQGHTEIVQLLIDHKCHLEIVDASGMTPLHYAALGDWVPVGKSLLTAGASVNVKGHHDITPLHLACAFAQTNMAVLLLRNKAFLHARDIGQRTALHMVALSGCTRICDLLLEHAAQIDARDADLKTPLRLAVEAGHVEIVERILSRLKVRPNDAEYKAAFFDAIETGKIPLVNLFINKGGSFKGLKDEAHKPISLAAKSGNLAMVDLVIKQKAKVKKKDNDGWTALHFAAFHGHVSIVEKLADKVIPTKSTTSKKETPLHLAAKVGHFEVTDILIRGNGALHINSKECYGQGPLHLASRAGNPDVINLLYSRKANLKAENDFGWKPIHIAVAYGNTTIVEQLLGLGASIEERTVHTGLSASSINKLVQDGYGAEARFPFTGSKPLHLAIEYERDDIARFLIKCGAKVNSTCGEGWRPLHLAAFNLSAAMVDVLLQAGAYPHAVTDLGRNKTALDICRSRPSQSAEPHFPAKSEDDKKAVESILLAASLKSPRTRQEQWRALKILKGKGPEDKSETLRAANLAKDLVEKGAGGTT